MAAPVRIFLTSGTSWTVPDDWNNGDNSVECIGGGGGGSAGGTRSSGGGGGAYARSDNVSLTPGASEATAIGAAGVSANNANGTNGGDTCFGGATLGACVVGAEGGKGGVGHVVASGGLAANSVGAIKYNGGSSGAWNSVGSEGGGGGGGGAGGPNGAGGGGGGALGNLPPGGGGGGNGGGAAGQDGGTSGTTGGNGGNNYLGVGGGAGGGSPAGVGTAGGGGGGGNGTSGNAGANGGDGQEWDSTHGSGGGGGGSGGPTAGGNGGLYGAGGGSKGGTASGGNGAQGIIVITYTPIFIEADFIPSGSEGYEPSLNPTVAVDAAPSASAGYEPALRLNLALSAIPSGSIAYAPRIGNMIPVDFIPSGSVGFEPSFRLRLPLPIVPASGAPFQAAARPVISADMVPANVMGLRLDLPGTGGNYASTPDSAAFSPAQENLIIRSEEIDHAAWIKSNVTVTANAATDSQGNLTLEKIETTVASNPLVYRQIGGTGTFNGVQVTAGVELKAGSATSSLLQLYVNGGGAVTHTNAVIISGPGSISGIGSSGITVTGLSAGAVTKIAVTGTPSFGVGSLAFYVKPPNASPTIGDYIFAGRAQCNRGATLHEYAKTDGNTVGGDIEASGKFAPTDAAAVNGLLYKAQTIDVRLRADGKMQAYFTLDGSAIITAVSSASAAFVSGAAKCWKVTRSAATGTVKFFTGADESSFAQLGTDQATTAGTLYASTASLDWGRSGGSALAFSVPSTQAVSVPDAASLQFGTSSFTLEFDVWFPPGTDNPQWCIGKGNAYSNVANDGGGPYPGGFGVAHWTTSDPVAPSFYVTDGVAARVFGAVASTARGVWARYTFVVDRAAQVIRPYKNGVPNAPSGSIAGIGSVSCVGQPFYLGRMGGSYFNGRLDNVRLYSRALSAAEVTEHANGVYTNETGLVGHWALDEGAGTSTADSSGSSNDGTLINTPTWVAGSGINGSETCADGKIYLAELRNDIDGPVVADFNPERDARPGDTSFVSLTGETWTVNQSGGDPAVIAGTQFSPSLSPKVALDSVASASVVRQIGMVPVLGLGFIGSSLTVFDIVLNPTVALDAVPSGSSVFEALVYMAPPRDIAITARLLPDLEAVATIVGDSSVRIIGSESGVDATAVPDLGLN